MSNKTISNQQLPSSMRKIGAHVSSAGGVLNAITNTELISANCMQIFAGSPRMWKRSLYPSKDALKFRELIEQKDLKPVFIHALYLTNLASENPELRQKTKEAIIMDLKNSSLIGSSGVVLHIGSHMGRGFDAVKDLVVEEVKDILARSPEDSTLILENSAGQKGKIGSFSEIDYIIKLVKSDRLKVCLDTAHAFEAGYPLNNSEGLDIFISGIKKTFGLDKLVVLHVNDSRSKLGSGHDVHDNIGEGFIGAKGLGQFINHPDLSDLPIILEVPGFDKKGPDKKNIDKVRSLLE